MPGKKTVNIVLVGMSGSGKSVLGKEAAKILGLNYIDLDHEVERIQGISIPEIFNLYGEPYFRELESRVIRSCEELSGYVISTGGGAVCFPENMKVLKNNNLVIWINRPIEKIAADLTTHNRPLIAGDPNRVFKIFNERKELYRSYADLEIINDGEIAAAVNLLTEAVGKYLNPNNNSFLN